MKPPINRTLGSLGTLLLSAGLAQGTIVYQDTFDNDGLATNTGIGGGGAVVNHNGGGGVDWGWDDVVETPTDNSGLFSGTAASGNRVSVFNSTNTFDLSSGFNLVVEFDMLFNDNNGSNATVPFNANHFSFGLATAVDGSSFLNTNDAASNIDGIGFSFGTRNSNVDIGVLQHDTSATDEADQTNTLSPFAASVGTGQTISITVQSDGSFEYTYGSETGSGTTDIDLSQEYLFIARTQGSDGNAIQSITLTTIPEPSVALLGGLGLLGLLRRRRN